MKLYSLTIMTLGLAGAAQAATVGAAVMLATPDGPGVSVGTVSISDSPAGAVFTTDLHGLPPGVHGFHVHDKGSCAAAADAAGKTVPAGAAGGHMDPAMAGKHEGPDGMGHLGDLPALTVAADGTARTTLTAPHIHSAAALAGHALMIHAGGDNYSDAPAPSGGGGGRLACGVIG